MSSPVESMFHTFRIVCPHCDMCGPERMTVSGALTAWNTRAALSTQPQQATAEESSVDGWISVNDRLPDLPVENEDDGVKVYTWNGDFVDEDEFAPEWEQPAGPAVGGWLRTGEWFCNDTANRVTHWKPRELPLPPAPSSVLEGGGN